MKKLFFATGLLPVLLIMLGTWSLHAATYVVANSNNAGVGSLRAAVDSANTNPGTDTITFAAGTNGNTIVLTSGEITIIDAVYIWGNDTSNTVVSGNSSSRIFSISEADSVTITGMKFINGYNFILGGAIANFETTLNINNCTFRNNVGGFCGGAIDNEESTLTIRNSVISNNTANGNFEGAGGGGIENFSGKLVVINSEITYNQAPGSSGSGGGIMNRDSLVITSSTIAHNTTDRAGGGIECYPQPGANTVTIMNSATISENNAGSNPGNGGGLHVSDSGDVFITSSTISGNQAGASGGGLWHAAIGTMRLDSTGVDGNFAHGSGTSNGGGGIFSNGMLIVNASTISNNTADGTNAWGGGLYNYSGSTATIANSTLSGNSSLGSGGGIYNSNDLEIESSTITQNTTQNHGGGIALGVVVLGHTVLHNTIVAENSATNSGQDVYQSSGSFTSHGYNLIGEDDNNDFPEELTDIEGTSGSPVDPVLGPLADNGGPTLTHALICGSPAINMGEADSATDQRGSARGFDGQDDIGSFELQTACGAPIVAGDTILGPSNPRGSDRLGFAVDLNGRYAIAGAPLTANKKGAAYIFYRDGTQWVQQDLLMAEDSTEGDKFGYAVHLTPDYAIIGAPENNDNGTASGAAYIFERNGTDWDQVAKLVPSDNQHGDYFGYSVAVAGDYAAIGALGDDDAGAQSGSVYIYWRNGSGNWVEYDKKTASDGAPNDYLGLDVDMTSTDIIAGAHRNSDAGTHSGSAYVFHLDGGTWSEQQKLVADDASPKDSFGFSVAIHGNDAIVGAIGHDGAAANAGAVYVFTRSGSTWTQQQSFTADDVNANDQFGNDVKLETDSAIVGDFMDTPNGPQSGSAYVFTRSGGTWSQEQKLVAPSPDPLDDFGRSVGISNKYAIVGASGDDSKGGNTGAVYFYNLGAAVPMLVKNDPLVAFYGSAEEEAMPALESETPAATNAGIEVSALNIEIYPNPATEAIMVQWAASKTDEGHVQILDANGKQVKILNGQGRINIADLSDGVYVVRINLDSQIHHRRLVVVK